MRVKLLTALAGAALFALAGTANARALKTLTDTQLDTVTAGQQSNIAALSISVALGANVYQAAALVDVAVVPQVATVVGNVVQLNILVSPFSP
jgi:urea transporter